MIENKELRTKGRYYERASSEHLNIGLKINIYGNYVYEYYKSQHIQRKDYKVKF